MDNSETAQKIFGMMDSNKPPQIAPFLIMIIVDIVVEIVKCFLKHYHVISDIRNVSWWRRMRLRKLVRKIAGPAYSTYHSDMYNAILRYGSVITQDELNGLLRSNGISI